MPYLPLPNFNHDSGPRRIQSGPDHEGYIVLYSGVESTGADDGFAVLGAPLSGTAALGAWDYDSNWRYVPSTLPSQSGSLDPTPYNVSGALDTYDATRIYTRDNVAGAQAASAIGPETGRVNPRGGALQARSDVTRPETYMYYGGAAPDNQDYSPYNTPDANSAAEGKTGGGVTHRSFESSLLTNVLGSQGTSDRSQWRYHQPVYCKTYTETRRSETPGLMSTPLRYVYRGSASSYNYNYGGELLANKSGFELLPYDDQTFGCPFPVGCPTNSGDSNQVLVGDTLSAVVYCPFIKIEWFRSNGVKVGEGSSYIVSNLDVGYKLYYKVTYSDGSFDVSSINCFETILPQVNTTFYWLAFSQDSTDTSTETVQSDTIFDNVCDMYTVQRYKQAERAIVHKVSDDTQFVWTKAFAPDTSQNGFTDFRGLGKTVLVDSSSDNLDVFYQRWTISGSNIIQPSRIYMFTINKNTGNLLQTKTLTFSPTKTSVEFTGILNIKKHGDYYYILETQTLTNVRPSTILTKLDSDLNVIWNRQLISLDTSCVITNVNEPTDLNISENKLFVSSRCLFANNFATLLVPVAFSIDFDGSNVKIIPPIRLVTGVAAFRYIYYCQSVETDSDESYYTVGGFNATSMGATAPIPVALSPIVKQDSTGSLVWATDLNATLVAAGQPSVIQSLAGKHLITVKDKLVFAAGLRTASSAPPVNAVVFYVISKDTGNIDSCRIINTAVPSGNNVSTATEVTVNKMPQNNGFIINTSYGYRFRLNLDSLPAAGTYTMSGSVGTYTVRNVTPTQSDILNLLEVYPGPCSGFSVVDPNTKSFYGIDTTVSGVEVPSSGTFSFGRTATV